MCGSLEPVGLCVHRFLDPSHYCIGLVPPQTTSLHASCRSLEGASCKCRGSLEVCEINGSNQYSGGKNRLVEE
jgi:hypothetical protein